MHVVGYAGPRGRPAFYLCQFLCLESQNDGHEAKGMVHVIRSNASTPPCGMAHISRAHLLWNPQASGAQAVVLQEAHICMLFRAASLSSASHGSIRPLGLYCLLPTSSPNLRGEPCPQCKGKLSNGLTQPLGPRRALGRMEDQWDNENA